MAGKYLEHSYGSYHLARDRNVALTADQKGHKNARMLYAHYREIVKVSHDTTDYWTTFPSDGPKKPGSWRDSLDGILGQIVDAERPVRFQRIRVSRYVCAGHGASTRSIREHGGKSGMLLQDKWGIPEL